MEYKKGMFAKETEDPYYLKDPILLELYKKCLPSNEAYFYFPKGNEIIEFNSEKPKKSYRKIYHNVPLLDIEKKYIYDYKQMIKNHPEIKLPKFCEDDDILLRFIYVDECDLEKAFKRLVKYIEWSNKTFPIIIQPNSKIIEMLNRGFVYVYGRDCKFRPILIFRLNEFIKIEKIYSVEEVIEAGCFLGQFVLNNMMIPGQIERWDLIIDLKNATLLSLPEHIKKLISVINEAFISRLHKNYIFGMTFLFRVLYKLVCSFLRDSTVKKIKVINGKKDQSLFEEIRRDNIETYFGGTAPDAPLGKEHGLFPPRMPSQHFLLENEKQENILISEEEYIQKYKNGELLEDWINPYILEKLNKNKTNYNTNENIEIEEEKPKEKTKSSKTLINIYSNDIKNNIQAKNIVSNIKFNTLNMNSNYNNYKKFYKSIEQKSLLNKKKTIKKFLCTNWSNNEEKKNLSKYKMYSPQQNNIIKDVYTLRNKRKKFF